ncbi:hypothetical protein T4D_15077 [Trichinella pseudospiralis]|uniref:Uncharacterized protein n=1 Tax=Trichinella pseudospiralis TaxID=6337 RepID=A0A0V1FWK4_TRIPS|nr:hypothetical protein T4D_15077 [Trichinella pseudospiralis]
MTLLDIYDLQVCHYRTYSTLYGIAGLEAGSRRTRDLLGRVNRPRAVCTFTDLVTPSLPINGSVITPSFHRFRGTPSSTRNTRSPFSGCRPILFHFPWEITVDILMLESKLEIKAEISEQEFLWKLCWKRNSVALGNQFRTLRRSLSGLP